MNESMTMGEAYNIALKAAHDALALAKGRDWSNEDIIAVTVALVRAYNNGMADVIETWRSSMPPAEDA